METQETTLEVSPPRLIKALKEGFNTVANHIGLIILPVVLDIFIWLGPRLRLENLLTPIVEQMTKTLSTVNTADMQAMITSATEAWNILLEQLNLTSSLSTFPIGLPSLMKGIATNQSPLGSPTMIEMPSFASTVLTFLGFVILGIILGGIYLSAISRRTAPEPAALDISKTAIQVINGFVLTIILIIILFVLSIPIFFMVSIVALFSPALSQIALLGVSFVLLWLLVPLLFSPHGIFAYQLSAPRAILTSIRLVRAFLPGVGMFLLTVILLAQGLDILWQAAPGTSWLTLVGITGHAFIYTAILAASFIYYRQGLAWIQNNISQYKKSINI